MYGCRPTDEGCEVRYFFTLYPTTSEVPISTIVITMNVAPELMMCLSSLQVDIEIESGQPNQRHWDAWIEFS